LGGVEVSSFLPFSGVVGQDDAKLALLLAACERTIGGVLLRGDKGTAKSTLARGLAALLPGDAPFVELPIGATEDRLVGTLDLTVALTEGSKRFDPGLLHAADGGVLYVDEINLLPDHLVDVLLDVAASGINRVEREGVSYSHPSRFVLVGSMNPEEGELRPQLLDRFGLAVEVRTPSDPAERAAALRRRLSFDAGTSNFDDEEASLAARLAAWRPAQVGADLVDAVARLCAAAGAEGLRADLTICRAAGALAGWEGRSSATPDDVRRVAPMALAHRARRDPLDPPGASSPLESALESAFEDSEERVAEAGTPLEAPVVRPADGAGLVQPATGRRGSAPGPRGRLVGDREPDGPLTSVAVGATVRRAMSRPGPVLVNPSDIREAVREQRTACLIVLAVDASGSMGASRRMETAKGAVLGLLRDAYQKRDLVSLVTFRGEEAQVVLRPTGSVEVARARLAELPTGGRTPLAAGLRTALQVASAPARAGTHTPLLVVITDARATAAPPGQQPGTAAAVVADEIRRSGITSVVIDVEAADSGGTRLGMAARLAEMMGARYMPLSDLSPLAVEDVVRQTAAVAGR
jgi:magnesium chelatase subunit D